MSEVSFSEQAYEDLEEIDRYTLETWGATQRERYLAVLFRQIEALAESPLIGRPRPELASGIMALPCLSHVIYYMFHESECHVVRVLHERRDVDLAFAPADRGPSKVSEAIAMYLPTTLTGTDR